MTSRLLERLAESEVEFVVVGGYAAVRRLLADLDPRHRMTPQKLSFLDVPPPGAALKNLYLRTRLGVVDLLSEILGVGGFERLKARACIVELAGRAVRVIALEDLITAKEALARDKDMLVAKELRLIALRQAQLHADRAVDAPGASGAPE
jgi:hypothetical protein